MQSYIDIADYYHAQLDCKLDDLGLLKKGLEKWKPLAYIYD